ncbi:MAG: ABC transporter permease [Nitrososphaerota archaeon]|nr:ABC transporter permease [Nitrososphaerota archaeon]MDG7023613.1 ABC transporter permease [Nitrososphaerota archaeon]
MHENTQGLRWLRATAYNALAVVLGIVAGLAVVVFAGGNIEVALSSLFLNPIRLSGGVQQIFVLFVMFYTMALGIGLALKAGLWNIGAQGQFLAGMVMVFVVYVYLAFLPWPVLYVAMILGAAVGGLLWIVVPTILRVKFGANEIVVTILLNVVAFNFGFYMLSGPIKSPGTALGFPITKVLPATFQIPNIIGSVQITYAVPAAIAIGVILYFLVERTPFRVKVNTVGESAETARYAGISIPRVMTITMLAAGALAGLAGATFIMGYRYELDIGSFSTNYGLIAIIVALVGRKHMLGVGISAFFFAYITIGAQSMALATNVPYFVVFAMEGVMMIGILMGSYLTERNRAT